MRRTMTALLAACAAATLSGCGEGYETDNAAAVGAADRDGVSPVTPPAPAPAAAATPGSWSQAPEAGSQALVFAAGDGKPVFRLACDDRGGILLERLGVEAAPKIERMEVTAGDLTASLAVNPLETAPQVLRAAVPFNHELMVPLAQKEGLLTVRGGDGPALGLPLTDATAALAQRCMEPDGASRANA